MNMILRILTIILSILFSLQVVSQNPISPAGVYIADPSAHVWNDGKLYIYGSLDESFNYYCSHRHHVMKTDDMLSWKIYEDAFVSKGKGDAVSYNDEVLFAPDCAYKNGTYYLYYCQPCETTEGVATSSSPTGPFTNGKILNTGGFNEIDPSLFIDDDGQAYYIWGQFSLKMAKMKPNMVELDLKTIKNDVITEKEHHFHEGAFLAKRNGIYYLVYADISRAEMPTCIGYATSKSIFGPYTYRGVIVDNSHCDPGNWNNHGSIVKFNEHWYVFYHRATHNSNIFRKACVEPIYFNPDGTIDEVEMTSQGAGEPLPATKKIETERACLLFGNVRINSFDEHNEQLDKMGDKDKVVFKYLDFEEGVKSVTLRIRSNSKGGKIELFLDKTWHKKIASIDINPANENSKWQTLTFDVKNCTGIHALWVVASGKNNNLFTIDWLKFNK